MSSIEWVGYLQYRLTSLSSQAFAFLTIAAAIVAISATFSLQGAIRSEELELLDTLSLSFGGGFLAFFIILAVGFFFLSENPVSKKVIEELLRRIFSSKYPGLKTGEAIEKEYERMMKKVQETTRIQRLKLSFGDNIYKWYDN